MYTLIGIMAEDIEMGSDLFLLRPRLLSICLVGLLLASPSAVIMADEGELEAIDQKAPIVDAADTEPQLAKPVAEADLTEVDEETEVSDDASEVVESFSILDNDVAPGSFRRLSWYPTETSAGLAEPTPVLVVHGVNPGPTLCLTAAVHGDEINGVEIARNLIYDLDPERLNGTVIGVPIVNLHGFRLGSRYLSDRRDLNRYFPGNPKGSSASRIAHSLFQSVILQCDYLVDLHTGSFRRANLPQLRADLNNEAVLNLTKGFGATVVLHGDGPDGSLRGAATAAGIPAVTLEAGEPMRVQPDEVSHGVKALRSLLNYLDMVPRFTLWGEPQPIYYKSRWVRAEDHGILTSQVKLGTRINEGDLLGIVVDPITNSRGEIRSPVDGRVIGMALNQSMRPGYAAYHIGIRKTEEQILEEADLETDTDAGDEDHAGEQAEPEIEEMPGSSPAG